MPPLCHYRPRQWSRGGPDALSEHHAPGSRSGNRLSRGVFKMPRCYLPALFFAVVFGALAEEVFAPAFTGARALLAAFCVAGFLVAAFLAAVVFAGASVLSADLATAFLADFFAAGRFALPEEPVVSRFRLVVFMNESSLGPTPAGPISQIRVRYRRFAEWL